MASSASVETIDVEHYDEIANRLSEPHASAVQHVLDAGDLALVLPNWIAGRSDRRPVKRSPRVFAGSILREEGNGVKFRSHAAGQTDDAWESKAESEIYALADGVERVGGGATSLTDYGISGDDRGFDGGDQ